ncbi:hypothetical protein Daura_22740 [Dactylosporangium aurantiacum]|uniref:NADH:quinone oxidoreductase/Mrp antiporter transmembrane domain-containing protein n=2 Tax=Dactylosporangium aurantiacum TaxID=35754 RepID=A0A9Q9MJ86_9ACTN|nr:proton-conducting transporter membrane subunit [Dactylosporangium aurantiacum]MDG6107672.1 proton-conducting transporter membrane subunit [Dactylosporangium aurantiacum]UWZ58734.1 hypothetical protein Daura_22740 [Dactylosporangium aurantiacum]
MLLIAVVLLPGVVSLAVVVARGRAARPIGAVGAGVAAALFACTMVLTAAVVTHGPVQAVVGRDPGTAWFGWYADRSAALLLMLVAGVSAMAQAFAGRYLSGDRGRGWFVAATGLLTCGSGTLVTGATLVSVAAGWTATGVGLVLLLRTYPQLPSARDGARRALRTFLVGDAALWTGVAAATLRWGPVDLRHDTPPAASGEGGWAAVITALLVVAALTRCAQVPWHRWLPASLAAPTPVSALLHAGVVNGGGVLLLRSAAITDGAPAILFLAVASGAASLVYGTAMMLVRPDVKGSLAYSTIGQMGFMIMTAGLGWHAITVLHIVGHGLYKAALFLGSGSAVERHARQIPYEAARPGRVRALRLAAALMTAIAVAGAEAWRPYPGGPALAVFVWASATTVCWGWLRRRATPAGALGITATVAMAAFAYVAIAHAATVLLALPDRELPGAGIVTAAVAAAAAAVGVLRHRGSGALASWHKTIYTNLLTADRGRRLRPAPARHGDAVARSRTITDPITVGTLS